MKSDYTGIETNNLKNIDISIPHNNIILIIGVSGSGKSSLAIDTIHNISMNELNQLMGLKDFVFNYSINQYDNILPSVSLEQENYNRNPRSTIATYFCLDVFIKNLFSIRNNVSSSIFKFNRYKYACKKCLGTGIELQLDPTKVIDYNSKLSDIPFLNWRGSYSDFYKQLLEIFCNDCKINTDKYILDLDSDTRNLLSYGQGATKYKINYKAGARKRVKTSVYIGPFNKDSIFPNTNKKQFYTEQTCPDCNGYRFSKEILQYKVYDKNIGELYNTEIDILADWILAKKNDWEKKKDEVTIFKSILSMVDKFIDLNLGYIYLNRSIPSLSGGELQRLRLAKSLNSQFNNFLYILDEPSSGLHPNEVSNIANNIVKLKKRNNTVIIIEHNEIFKNISDKTIILGPSGGKNGGKIISNQFKKFIKNDLLYTFFQTEKFFKIKAETCNNICNLSTQIPLETFVSICGMSGSGKTSFLSGILPKYFKNTIYLNQTPLKGNNYSIVASYIGIIDDVRKNYAIKSGQESSLFSFHHTGDGKCKNCNGAGIIKNEDTYNLSTNMICPSCNGMRFNFKVLSYRLKGINIYQFLNLTVDELIELLSNDSGFVKTIKTLSFLSKIGLGYLTLFRNISTLSGGEAQRIKICHSLSNNKKKSIYLLDEPLRGVDDFNAHKIITLLYDIVKKGNSVFVAEHNLIAINHSSYIIEFGPGGGKYGGRILYNGEKHKILSSKQSIIRDYIDKIS